MKKYFLAILYWAAIMLRGYSQSVSDVFLLDSALSAAEKNYPSIRAKLSYEEAAREKIKEEKLGYLPVFNLHAQQVYSTANSLVGSFFPSGVVVPIAGATLDQQNWNAAFSSVYLADLDWDVFSFGRVNSKVEIAKANYNKAASDLQQEKFELQIKVISAYVSSLAARELRIAAEKNMTRAQDIQQQTYARTSSGLNAGVDTSFANAEVANAQIILLKAKQTEQEQTNLLAMLTGLQLQNVSLDSALLNHLPAPDSVENVSDSHPMLQPYAQNILISKANEKYLKYGIMPKLSLSGTLQTRGSGFSNSYDNAHLNDYTSNYVTGISPARDNYFAGLTATWNILSIPQITKSIKSEKKITEALQSEYDMEEQQLQLESDNARLSLQTSLQQSAQTLIQMKAASDAYSQKNVLYQNGLITITDLAQSFYNLNRAETDVAVYHASTWQALLQQAAAVGNLSVFLNQYHR